MAKDYYESLGLTQKATAEEIKAAYKRLAKQHHPDLNKNNKTAEEKFKEINEAYRVLGDEKKRAQYDRFGHDEQTQSQGQQQGGTYEDFEGFDINLGDIFGEFFGGGSPFGRGGRSNRGEDLGLVVQITLEEAATGKKQKVNIDRLSACSECKGTGAEGGKRKECPDCKGQGRVRRVQRTPFGAFQTVVACQRCAGTGNVSDKACAACEGQGRVEQEEAVTFELPAGIADGMQMRVPGKGNAGGPGQSPGDLLVSIRVREHELFAREGDDLHIISTITYPQAVLGSEIEVPTLFGSIKMTIPSGTESHTVFRARGKGMPKLRGGHGDLLVTAKIAVPKNPGKQEKEIIEKLAGIEKPKSFFERFKL